ncbi:MAG: hypothetical protein WC058_07520 [Phycisphaeraceae bacterium]
MLLITDLSGIQDYLFVVRETGGKQAKSLRFRSLYIQLIADAVGVRLLHATDLNESRLISCAAGKIVIDGTGLSDDKIADARKEICEIECWLRDKTHARLRLSAAIRQESDRSIREQYDAANQTLQSEKLRSWSNVAGGPSGWRADDLIAATPPDAEEEAKRDAELGRQVVQSNHRFVVLDPAGGQGADVAGLTARFVADEPTSGNDSCNLNRLARHIPTDARGEPIEFVNLAKQSRGAAMLGVLKADADSLGAAIGRCLDKATDLQPLRDLSNRLEKFFASDLDQQMCNDPRWSKLYTVFSGGDDLLLVGCMTVFAGG